MRFLCRFGWHRWSFETFIDQEEDGEATILTLTTKARCRLEGCERHLWWVTCDQEEKVLRRTETLDPGLSET